MNLTTTSPASPTRPRLAARSAGLCLALSLALGLAACGGGGSDNGSSSNNSGSNSGGGTGGNTGGGTGSTASALSSTCKAALPNGSVAAVAISGEVGTATVNAVGGGALAGMTLEFNSGVATAGYTLTSATGGCTFTISGQGSQPLAWVRPSLGIGYGLSSSGQIKPLLFVGDLHQDLTGWAGRYNLLRYQIDTAAGASAVTRTTWATLVIDAQGQWSLYKQADASGTPTATGTLVPSGTDRFSLTTGSSSTAVDRATVLMSGADGQRLLVIGEHDPGDAQGAVQGLWIGAPQAAASTQDGSYLTINTDPGYASLSLKGNTITTGKGTQVNLTADQPLPGLRLASSPTTAQVMVSPAGLMAIASNESGAGYLEFGLVPSP